MSTQSPPVRVPPRWLWFLGLAVLVISPWTLATTQALWPRWLAMMALAWWLPGVLLVLLWRLPRTDLPTVTVLALALGLCWMVLLALLAHWFPGPIGLWPLVALYAFGALALLLALARRPLLSPVPLSLPVLVSLCGLVLVAATLRLPGLGYHEFHADEVVLLRQSRRAIEGDDAALAEHTKGPGEIAVALVVYRALGTADEATARLPFALASVASVLALALLGGRLFNPTVGWVAGLLLAVNGFALGLSRIAQYQAVILLLSALSMLAAWEFYRGRERRWLLLLSTLTAFGLIFHYEFGLLAPALACLVVLGWRRARRAERGCLVNAALWGGTAGGALVAAAYVPAIVNPYFATTQGYLANRLGEIGTFNLPFLVEMGTFYNSTYFFAGLVLLAGLGSWLGWRRARLPLVVLWLWWLPFFLLYIFVVRYPGTHFYLLMESWSLLAALPLAALATDLQGMLTWRRVAAVAVAAWLVVSIYYLYLVFFRQAPEYVMHYDTERLPFYWAPYGERIPEKPRFGFPIQVGWKVAGVLGQWGYLPATYASNDGAWELRRWYLTPYDKRDPDQSPGVFFIATLLHEPNPEYDDVYLQGYLHVGDIFVRGEPRLQIWTWRPLPVPYVAFDAEQFAPLFEREVNRLEPLPDPPALVESVPLDEHVRLVSAHLERRTYRIGETIHLLLVWQTNRRLQDDYKVFVHVADESGRPVAQWDGYPGLNTSYTSRWPVGWPFRDHVLLTLGPDLTPGTYTLLVGMYHPETGQRVGDRAIPITTLSISS